MCKKICTTKILTCNYYIITYSNWLYTVMRWLFVATYFMMPIHIFFAVIYCSNGPNWLSLGHLFIAHLEISYESDWSFMWLIEEKLMAWFGTINLVFYFSKSLRNPIRNSIVLQVNWRYDQTWGKNDTLVQYIKRLLILQQHSDYYHEKCSFEGLLPSIVAL